MTTHPEVPQATAREEAVEVMRGERRRHDFGPMNATCECGWRAAVGGARGQWVEWSEHVESSALDALLSPRTVPCATCGGAGAVPRERDKEPGRPLCGDPMHRHSGPCSLYAPRCPDCSDGSVTLGPLAVLVGELEQVGWCWPDNDGRGGQTWPYGIVQLRKKPTLADDMEPVFRLPSSKEPHA